MEYIKDILDADWNVISKSSLIQSLIVVLVSVVMVRIVKLTIKRLILKNKSYSNQPNRSETVLKLLNSAVTYAIYFLALLQLLHTLLGVSPATVIAATGIAGVAISFGAQGLVKDVISGFFIVFENQFAVGEMITVSDFTGTVLMLGLRTTQIKDSKGDILIVQNGSIDRVINHSRGIRGMTIDVHVSYDTDIDRAAKILNETLETAVEEIPDIMGTPSVLGISGLNSSSVSLRIFANCETGAQFAVERALLKRIKKALDAGNIAVPTKHIVVLSKDTDGE